MTDLVQISKQTGKVVTTSLKVAEVFEKLHKDVMRAIRNLDCSSEFYERNFAPVKYQDTKGEFRPMFEMTRDGFTFLAMGFTGKKAVRFKEDYIKAFNMMEEELKKRNTIPSSPAEILVQAANQLLEHERKIKALEEQQNILNTRMNGFDGIIPEGDLRTQFGRAIKKYSYKKGISHGAAWNEFVKAFNAAFRTNLRSRITHEQLRRGVAKITIPEYLEAYNLLEDALRVADKLLNVS